MRFKVDQNLHDEIAELFRARGHDAATVYEQGLDGKSDLVIAEVCKDEQRAVVTLDLDFADELVFPPAEYHGLIVLRLEVQSRPRALKAVSQVFDLLDKEPLDGCLWIVEEFRIRVRRPPKEKAEL